MTGNFFTLWNKQVGDENIESKLYPILVNTD